MTLSPKPDRSLTVWDGGEQLRYTFADCMRYHGPEFPGGVAHAFAALARALPELAARTAGGKVDRRSVRVRTPFAGPGARDTFELVTRAVSGGRYEVLPELARPERGAALSRYLFEVSAGEAQVTCVLREDGVVTTEYLALSERAGKSVEELAQLAELEAEMRERVLSGAPAEVYALEYSARGRGALRSGDRSGAERRRSAGLARREHLARNAPHAFAPDQSEVVAEVRAQELSFVEHRVGDLARHDDAVDLRGVLRTRGDGRRDHVRGEIGAAHRDGLGAEGAPHHRVLREGVAHGRGVRGDAAVDVSLDGRADRVLC